MATFYAKLANDTVLVRSPDQDGFDEAATLADGFELIEAPHRSHLVKQGSNVVVDSGDYEDYQKQRLLSQLYTNAHSFMNAALGSTGDSLIGRGESQSNAKAQATRVWIRNFWSDVYSREDAINGGDFGTSVTFENITGKPHRIRDIAQDIGEA